MNAEATQKSAKKVRVIDSLWTFAVAVAVVGPFALPLLWRNPRFSRFQKILGSAVIGLVTLFCIWMMKVVPQTLLESAQGIR